MFSYQSPGQKFFYVISKKQIDDKLLFLKKSLPSKITRSNFQLTKNLLKVNRVVTEKTLQNNLQEVADRMREHLQIDKPIKILTISNIEGGKFEKIDDLNCIYINGKLNFQNYGQKLAILAHEMSHFFLIYQHKIYLTETNENELLTELNAIYSGFGLLLLDGYKIVEKRNGNMVQKSKVGYIDLETIKRTVVRTAYLRKQNPVWILKNVSGTDFLYFSVKLFGLIVEYYRAKWKK